MAINQTHLTIGLLKQTFIRDCVIEHPIANVLNKLNRSLFSFPFDFSVPFWNFFIGLLKKKTSLLNIFDDFFGLSSE